MSLQKKKAENHILKMYKNISWKGLNIKQKKNKNKIKFSKSQVLINCNTILPKLTNSNIVIYNGKILNKIVITKDMVNFKIGEFVRTRKEFSFKKKKKSGSKN